MLFFWVVKFQNITYNTVIVLDAHTISEATPGSFDLVERNFLEEEVNT